MTSISFFFSFITLTCGSFFGFKIFFGRFILALIEKKKILITLSSNKNRILSISKSLHLVHENGLN